MEALRLHWFGLPRVELRGRPIKLETRKSVALLAYLSMGGEKRQREQAATMFWPEGSQERALGNLRRTLSSLNTRLPGWLEADRDTVALRIHNKLWVDVVKFHELVASVKKHCGADHDLCDKCRQRLEQALASYEGDFLEGLVLGDAPEFDDWQFFERETLRRELGGVLKRLTQALADGDQWERTIEIAQRWLMLDPLNEAATRALMTALLGSGDRSAAMHQYEELDRLLRERQDRQPENDTRRLYEQIRGPQAVGAPPRSGQTSPVTPIVKTKLYVPSPPASRVKRTGLVAQLRQAEQRPLTLISSPAGSGKTTLLAEWIAETSVPVAWLSLDAGDNDPQRFLRYLAEALEGIQEGISAEVRALIGTSGPITAPNIMPSVINALGTLSIPAVLVLDDYHFITEHAVHEVVTYLVEHIPQNLHLVISTRTDPPFPLGRLRAHGQLLELRTRELRFSQREASVFLNIVMQLGLSSDDIRALAARTEGWVVGLQMAALSLQGHINASEFIRAFSGSHRYVLDYLVEEVLRRQPERIQTFLLETSILDKLNGPLCDALMASDWSQSGEAGQATLEYLERCNLFVVPLDDEKQWYRYHHLFAELLRSRLQLLPAETIVGLHTRASVWFESQGLLNEAINHALLSKDYQRSAVLLDRNAQTSALTDVFAVQRWIKKIPAEIISEHPWIQIAEAWIALSLGELDGIEPHLSRAEDCLRDDHDPRISTLEAEDIRCHVAVIQAYIAFFRGQTIETIERALLARKSVRRSNAILCSRIALQLGEAYFVLGELEDGARHLQEAIRLSTADRDCVAATVASFRLAGLFKVQGRLIQAEEVYKDNLRFLQEIGVRDSPISGKPEIGLGDLLRERGQLDAAQRLLSAGQKHSLLQAQPFDLVYSYIGNALLAEARGKEAEALDLLSQAEPLFTASTNPPVVRVDFEYHQVKTWLRMAKLDLAERWVADCQLDSRATPTFPNEPTLIAFARVLIAQERFDEAAGLLDRLKTSAEMGGRNGRLIEIMVLTAIALQGSGRPTEARQAMVRALQLAEPEGYLRIFLDEGRPVLDILEQSLHLGLTGNLADYARKLLASTADI